MWIIVLTGAIFVSFLGMTLPIYFNLGAELIYPIGEAHGTTLFTSGMNFFGLLIIELTKVIDLQNNGLLWTGVFQGGLLFFGLVFLIGRVERLKPTSNYSLLNTLFCRSDFIDHKLVKVTKEDLKRAKANFLK